MGPGDGCLDAVGGARAGQVRTHFTGPTDTMATWDAFRAITSGTTMT